MYSIPQRQYQVYNMLGFKIFRIAARNAYDALRIAKKRGVFAPMVDAEPVAK